MRVNTNITTEKFYDNIKQKEKTVRRHPAIARKLKSEKQFSHVINASFLPTRRVIEQPKPSRFRNHKKNARTSLYYAMVHNATTGKKKGKQKKPLIISTPA